MSFIPAAFAADAAAPAGAGYTEIIMLVVFAIVAYMLIIRPQSKRMKEQKQLIASLAKGDEVATIGGIVGKISSLDDNFFLLTVSPGVDMKFQRHAVAQIFPKGTIKAS